MQNPAAPTGPTPVAVGDPSADVTPVVWPVWRSGPPVAVNNSPGLFIFAQGPRQLYC